MQKLILGLAGALAAVVAGAAIFLLMKAPAPAPAPSAAGSIVQASGADIGGPFELTAHTGARMTAAAAIDGPTLIYFGYTFCPDVCPFDTQRMVEAVDLLDGRGIDVTPVFITIDPERDTLEAMRYFADAMHPKLIGLTGTAAEIKAAADAYKVFYARAEAPDSAADYLMNHTTYTYFMLPDGLGALFRKASPEEMADEVERVLRERGEAG